MEEKLKYIYDDIYRWLIFAEAKNLALITILLFFIEKMYKSAFNDLQLPYKTIIFIFISLSCLLLIVSLIPFLNNNDIIKKCVRFKYEKYSKIDNIIFYGTIFYKINSYEGIIKQLNDSEELSKFEHDLINQIKETASVALIKIWFFDTAMRIIIFGICLSFTLFLLCT